jgi:hypothetical protein
MGEKEGGRGRIDIHSARGISNNRSLVGDAGYYTSVAKADAYSFG